jgi:hypothetical protein
MNNTIADDSVGPAALLEWDEPLGIAFYPDYAKKSELVSRMVALAAPRACHTVRDGAGALKLTNEHALIIVDPENEKATVQFFDHNRDHFSDVTARILILLLRGGAGEQALKDAPALSSFAREASFEVAPAQQRDCARADFEGRHGFSPEEWLTRWRNGDLPDTLENNLALGDALALRDEP